METWKWNPTVEIVKYLTGSNSSAFKVNKQRFRIISYPCRLCIYNIMKAMSEYFVEKIKYLNLLILNFRSVQQQQKRTSSAVAEYSLLREHRRG
jgi:hypothetical protein